MDHEGSVYCRGSRRRFRLSRRVVACLVLIAGLCLRLNEGDPSAVAAELVVDCSKVVGEVRTLHGVNNGPLDVGGTVDLSAHHRELAFPSVRLHDAHWPNPDVVDVHAVFPNLDADPDRPESYDFARTDEYLRPIVAAGSGVVYRLGESIEHTKRKYRVHPPKDPEKWAAACVGIIRHYNEGWAGGERHGIRYWEIWNEPDNRPNMWTGSDEEFFRLYAATAKAIRRRFPDVKVGGPAVGNVGPLARGDGGKLLEPSPFVAKFLDFCKRESVPLDFFSWHLYSDDPRAFAAHARAVRGLLDDRGFSGTESHLNEWNYLPDGDWGPVLPAGQGLARERHYERIGGAEGAAFTAAALLYLQDGPIDAANYYAGDTNPFGLFTRHGVPRKTFYAFKAFKMLLETPVRVDASLQGGGAEVSKQDSGSAFCAGMARDRTRVTVIASNFNAPGDTLRVTLKDLPWSGPTAYEVFRLDADHDLAPVRIGKLEADKRQLAERLPAQTVCVIRLASAATKGD